MSGEQFGAEGHVSELDADAVCAQCNTVNDEGTLICKTCGTNLRDQRTTRLAADQALDGTAGPARRGKLLSGMLYAFAILAVLWVALNVQAVSDWLIRAEQASINYAERLWTGEDSPVFNELSAQLEAVQPTPAQIAEARRAPLKSDAYDGKYVLMVEARQVGLANVQARNGMAYFVARLNSGIEVRGKAQIRPGSVLVDIKSGGYLYNGSYTSLMGIALKRQDGILECVGGTETSRAAFKCTGYLLAN